MFQRFQRFQRFRRFRRLRIIRNIRFFRSIRLFRNLRIIRLSPLSQQPPCQVSHWPVDRYESYYDDREEYYGDIAVVYA